MVMYLILLAKIDVHYFGILMKIHYSNYITGAVLLNIKYNCT